MEEYRPESGISFPKTYRITLGRRVFVVITSIPILIFIAGILIALGVRGPGTNVIHLLLVLIVIAGNCVIFLPRLVSALSSTVTIDSEKIVSRMLWNRRQLELSDVLGFEVNRDTNAIDIVPAGKGKKGIALSVHLEDFFEIAEWVKATFKNLSAERYQSEFSDIFDSDRYGADHRTRKDNFQIANLRARSITIVAIAVSLWTLLYPKPLLLAVAASALLPLFAIWALLSSRGLILLDAHSWRVPPTISQALLMPAVALFYRSYADYTLVSISSLWFPLLTGIAVTALVLFLGVKDFREERQAVIPTIFFVLMFVYGVIIEANCLFDPFPPATYPARVQKKAAHFAALPAFYRVEIGPWQYAATPSEERVTKEVYEALEEGDSALVEMHPGLLGVSWYVMTWYRK